MNILLFTPDYIDKMYGGIAIDAENILDDYLKQGHNVTLVVSRYKSLYGDNDREWKILKYNKIRN